MTNHNEWFRRRYFAFQSRKLIDVGQPICFFQGKGGESKRKEEKEKGERGEKIFYLFILIQNTDQKNQKPENGSSLSGDPQNRIRVRRSQALDSGRSAFDPNGNQTRELREKERRGMTRGAR
jgi:hypothetical protein